MSRTSEETVKKKKEWKFQSPKCDLKVLFWKEQPPLPHPDSPELR